MTRRTNTGERGIYKRREGRFEATVTVTRKKSGRYLTVHVGAWPTLEEAIIGRREFINTL